MITTHRFATAGDLVTELSAQVTAILRDALASRGTASLVVSGGRTPGALFESLSGVELDWRRVWVTLADERWVDATDAQSNEHLLRATLLRNAAALTSFVPLKNAAPTPEEGAAAAATALRAVPRPFDLVLLGLGEDGHTASLFPGARELPAALAADAPATLAVTPPAAQYARLTLSRATLLDARAIAFLIQGEAKWETYQRVLKSGPVEEYPARAFLHQDKVPVAIYWSP